MEGRSRPRSGGVHLRSPCHGGWSLCRPGRSRCWWRLLGEPPLSRSWQPLDVLNVAMLLREWKRLEEPSTFEVCRRKPHARRPSSESELRHGVRAGTPSSESSVRVLSQRPEYRSGIGLQTSRLAEYGFDGRPLQVRPARMAWNAPAAGFPELLRPHSPTPQQELLATLDRPDDSDAGRRAAAGAHYYVGCWPD